MKLATNLDAWEALLAGEHVDPGQLDPKWLKRAQTLDLVRLDKKAIELLFPTTHDWEVDG